ncbi:DUF3087 family protein [Neptuniibacter sp.]|uniref:DUF3087 family protein n=1 Tax=Neptuniibacter sp. TaxID=1962643 RepID=UPI0026205211|nr:DUF3087 family protein [Neptuniibacter sp.]MCP4597006.1 DUF3087 family protein [Neptuniibacter sp.]
MELREIDKEVYKQKQRKVAVVLCLIFAVLGLGLSALLRNYYGNPEGENMMVNLTGVLIGLILTIVLFSQVSSKPYFDELRYAWNLKKQALKIQNHRHKWEAMLEEGNQTAATVLAFYHKATLQLQQLERNEFGYSETVQRENKFLNRCDELGLSSDADAFSIDMLLQLK